MQRDRNWRRAQRDRALARVANWRLWQHWWPQDDIEGIARAQRIRAGARACCSCWMCGNPRKWHGDVTRAEQIADLRDHDED